MRLKLIKQVNTDPIGAEIEVSPERGRIMIADGIARPITANAPSTDTPPFSKLEGFGTDPLAMARNKMVKSSAVHKK